MDYNPRSPQNIGMEWVPIKQGDFSPDNINEYGYVMRLDHSATVVSGGIGLSALPPQVVANIAEGINIYPQITAMETGPVRMVTIPVQSGTITGAAIILSPGASSIASALASPMDNDLVLFSGTSVVGTDALGLNFGVTAFANELNGKRIVKVRLIYTASSSGTAGLTAMDVSITRKANWSEAFNYTGGLEGAVGNDSPQTLTTNFNYVDFGDWNPTWGPGITAFAGDTIYPWRYNELANLDTATAINVRQQILFEADLAAAGSESVFLTYVALQVFYCEETRVGYGGRRQIVNPATLPSSFNAGELRVPIRSTALATSVTLAPGNYIVTATNRPVSNFFTAKLPPVYSGIRQFNEDPPPVVGVTVKPTIVIDDPFTSEESDVLTDLSLYSSVAAVTGTHVYATQIQAPVYGSITAVQEILPRGEVVAGTSLTQARFYARRFADTTQPLKIALTGGTATQVASISVADFDALDEIFDGWREVTLTLGSSISVTGSSAISVTWSSTGEVAGNQWQVLGAQTFTTSPNVNVASYNPPAGGTTELTWKSPNQTSSTLDAQADATIILAQDPPTVTGFTLSLASQAVTGVATECGVVPSNCIPTAISYVGMTWNPLAACDDFDRVVASGMGTTPQGQTWTQSAGFSGTTSVDGDKAVMGHTITLDGVFETVDIGNPNQDIMMAFSSSVLATGAANSITVVGRFTDTSNYYGVSFNMNTDTTVNAVAFKTVAGSGTVLGTQNGIMSYDVNSIMYVNMRIVGTWIYIRAWNSESDEPTSWMMVFQDTSLSTGNGAGFRSRREGGNTNTAPVLLYVNSFTAMPARYLNGQIEIQRMDDLTDWQTIMLTDMCSVSMRDFEARVGETSWYRIRTLDSLDFAGPWVTGSATLTAPGVTVSGSGDGVLIFTSNRLPDSNLVYPMVWDGRPIESFAFPEADTQTFQRMYGRDFQVAFRPLERGGEQFERVMLVQAAAIPIPSMANFGSLRDLAWADLPYVCVRDELGNRWYANVLVPAGTVQRGRRIYLAQIRVTEVTDTAAPVT